MNPAAKPALLAPSPIRQSHTIIANLAGALALAQAEYPDIKKGHTAKVTAKGDPKTVLYEFDYADLAGVMNAVRPVLAKHGLSVQHLPFLKGATVFIICRLSHKSGEWMEVDYPAMTLSTEGGINHQALGGAITFAKRQSYCAVTGVAAESDRNVAPSDDGNESRFEPQAEPPRQAAQPPRRSPPRQEKPAALPSSDPLVTAMLEQKTVADLEAWHKTNEGRIRAKPGAWQDDFYARLDDHRLDMKASSQDRLGEGGMVGA